EIGESLGFEEDDLIVELGAASNWDVATRYHEFKQRPSVMKDRKLADHLRNISASAVLERAQAGLRSVVRPPDLHSDPWPDLPTDALAPEIDLEDTLENAPWIGTSAVPSRPDDIWMQYQTVRHEAVSLSVDTS